MYLPEPPKITIYHFKWVIIFALFFENPLILDYKLDLKSTGPPKMFTTRFWTEGYKWYLIDPKSLHKELIQTQFEINIRDGGRGGT